MDLKGVGFVYLDKNFLIERKYGGVLRKEIDEQEQKMFREF